MKKNNLLLLISITIITSCSKKSPEELAKKACDCYKEAKSIKNQTKLLRKMDECFNVVQSSLQELEQLGIDNDWSDEQVERAKSTFNKIYDNCDGSKSENSVSDDYASGTNETYDNTVNHDAATTTLNEVSNAPLMHDNQTINNAVKEIKAKFYAINYKKLQTDTIETSENFEDDLTIVFKDKSNKVVKIIAQMRGANIISSAEYYYSNNNLYFIYEHQNATNTNPNGYQKRTYVYNNDIIKIIENGNEISCKEDCDFSLQSKPYRLMRHYYALEGN
ncbi:hypothetical protein [Pedobacter nanyangensis]|uniref:hypothetical protein n=1 Tax=Pedobacter nanyangensis TaxID=1562389 RepID=UPI000DE3B3DB|nr:hypothetical protein [Pedobacter nanyangensis]